MAIKFRYYYGTSIGGKKASITTRKRNGDDFYSLIGRKGGRNGHTGGFACEKKGSDGLTGSERARIAGRKGGLVSRKTRKKES